MNIKEETVYSNVETANSKQLAILKKHFPNCFDRDGNFIQERMLEVVNANEVELSKESYSLNWLGKSYSRLLANLPPKTLIHEDVEHNTQEQHKDSKNLLIKGDNLEVLKHLVNAYSEKVKMIYIDPPYNTGSDGFVYNDDRKFTKEQLAELAGIDLEEAKHVLSFADKGSSSHSAWMTFMYPRLTVARELLMPDGVILMSIGDDEYSQLKLMSDEVFGEENFMGCFIWEGGRKNDAKRLSVVQDYILVYVKSDDYLKRNNIKWKEKKEGLNTIYDKSEQLLEKYGDNFKEASKELKAWFKSLPSDEPAKEHNHYDKIDAGGPYYGDNISSPNYRENLIFEWKGFSPPTNGWRYNREAMARLDSEGLLIYPEDSSKRVQYKRYLKHTETWTPSTHIYKDRRAASKSLKKLMGAEVFDFPKDVNVLAKLIRIFAKESDIIVDFFAGSGSFAEATYLVNAEDGKANRFISVQLAEATKEKSGAFKAGYKTIFDVTKQRITLSARSIKSKYKEFGGDLGFKIFETVEDFRIEEDSKELALTNLTMFDDVLLTDEQYQTLLTTWALYDGSDLTTPIYDIDLDGYTAHLCDRRLYMIAPDFSSSALKTLLHKLDDIDDKDFDPNKIVYYANNFDSVKQMELNEALKSYTNKKSIEIDVVVRN
ncbi:site-specific DNA-methyltransferase [Pseudoalteromonas phenolica]|uniref:site-specific DNA-methyltransferase (adenine-specific) n=1 Tax=Pseudoalteromonas phenolica TaxID=161398 RepID=A0A0S2JXU1_9GAMM|nr:site-specific DNA-methyltransferase [Pseudoalteromonas phenolica]ALO40806.1 Type III restriction-modification system enzyme [Pseudoalteromonas phenolica]MBE0354675.1 site-specific DNA-methyltransferase (adenine-specific) [Pseudoalteromonas phenolica O-BC30]RXF04927.1 site-specific DNA-methyltransferase [Pseudoalteromonas phenolica O-BC30]